MARLAILAALAIGPCLPNLAHAFGGLYVAGDGPPRLADAAEVVLMRDGTRTVLTVRPTYRGPAEPFALVLPVPQTVTERDIEVLARGALDALDLGTAPRLVEYWERDPCEAVAAAAAGQGETELGATVDSPLVAGEYQIAIVAPKDAAGLEAWLRRDPSGFNSHSGGSRSLTFSGRREPGSQLRPIERSHCMVLSLRLPFERWT